MHMDSLPRGSVQHRRARRCGVRSRRRRAVDAERRCGIRLLLGSGLVPDGKWTAFVDRGDVPGDLYVIEPDGSDRRQLTHSNGTQPGKLYGARAPTWAPDGRKLAFGYGYDGIHVVGADGNGLHRLVASGLNPDWSPGGRKIAYAHGGETDPLSLYVVNPDGSGRQLVGRPPDYGHSYNTPTWSPDGQRLAFTVGPAPDTSDVDAYQHRSCKRRSGGRDGGFAAHARFGDGCGSDGAGGARYGVGGDGGGAMSLRTSPRGQRAGFHGGASATRMGQGTTHRPGTAT